MKLLNIIIISILMNLFNFNNIYSQELSEEEKILHLILQKSIDINDSFLSEYYLESSKPKTYFDKNNFIEETGLINIPVKILNELDKESNKYEDTKSWDINILEKFSFLLPYFASEKCLTKEDVKNIQKVQILIKDRSKVLNPYVILTVYNPVFDKNKNHCVITLVRTFYIGNFESRTYLLKKIYGKWVVIEEFNLINS